MRNMGLAAAVAASIASSGCVQTRQYADVQFAPPSGDYKLLVLRPDVTVGSLTTGGMVEPRADWTEQARASITAALRAQQASRGGNVTIVEHRNQLPGVGEQELADIEDKLAAARRYYNQTVYRYHSVMQSFPPVLIAKPFGFHQREFFGTDERDAPVVSFAQQ